MVEEKLDKLYVRHKLAGNLDKWESGFLSKLPTFRSQYDFDNYNFKINDVVYRDYSNEFESAIKRLQVWAQLNQRNTRNDGFMEMEPGGFGYKK